MLRGIKMHKEFESITLNKVDAAVIDRHLRNLRTTIEQHYNNYRTEIEDLEQLQLTTKGIVDTIIHNLEVTYGKRKVKASLNRVRIYPKEQGAA